MDYHPHITSYSGHQVLDESGDEIGTITDVVFEDGSTTPAWFIVDPGWLRSNRFVPADGAHQSPNGDVIVTYNKRWVTTSPKAGAERVLPSEKRQALLTHYRTVAW